MELTGIGNTNLYGLLSTLAVCVAWAVVELRRRRNGKEPEPPASPPHPNGKLATQSYVDLAIAHHQESCPVAKRIEARIDRFEVRIEERLAAIDEAIREVWRTQAERGRRNGS